MKKTQPYVYWHNLHLSTAGIMAVYHMYMLVAHSRLTLAIDLTAFVPESPYIMPIVMAVNTCRNHLR